MKTYKEVYDDIEVPQELKHKTAMAMTKKRKYQHKKALAVCEVVCIGMMIFTILQVQNAFVSKPEQDMLTNKKEAFHLREYVNRHDIIEKAKTIGAGDIAGDVRDMSKEEREAFLQEFVAHQDLTYPKGYTIQARYGMYVYEPEHIGPYPYVIYTAEKAENYSILVEIKNKHIPRCIPAESDLKAYKDYRLSIYHWKGNDGALLYNAYIEKGEYEIDIYASVEKSEDFEIFMQSFLE